MTAKLFLVACVTALVVVSAQTPSRIFVVVFDDQHLSPGALRRAQAAATGLFADEFQPGDLGGLVVDGQLVNNRLFADRAELLRAIQIAHPRPDAAPAPDISPQAQAAGGAPSPRLAETETIEAGRGSTERALASLDALLGNLGRVDGRKAVVLFSEGFGGDDSSARVRGMIAAAGRADVRFHVLDESGSDRDAASGLVRATGGIVARRSSAFASTIAQIARDTSARSAGVAATAAGRPAPEPASAAPASDVGSSAGDASSAPPVADGVVVPATPSTDPHMMRVRPLAESHVKDLAGGDWSDAHARAGWEAYQRGDLDSARDALAPAAARPGAPSWVQYVLGQADYALRRFKEAADAWEQVRSRHPAFQPVYLNLADDYVQMNKRGKALDILRTARRRWPLDVDLLNALGVTEAAGGAFDDAIRTFSEAAAIAPNEAGTYLNLGKCFEMRYFKVRRYLPQPRLWVTNERDRENATKNYERYLEMGGPYADVAREGVARLKAVDNRPIG